MCVSDALQKMTELAAVHERSAGASEVEKLLSPSTHKNVKLGKVARDAFGIVSTLAQDAGLSRTPELTDFMYTIVHVYAVVPAQKRATDDKVELNRRNDILAGRKLRGRNGDSALGLGITEDMIEIDTVNNRWCYKSVEDFMRMVCVAFEVELQIGLDKAAKFKLSVDGTPTQNHTSLVNCIVTLCDWRHPGIKKKPQSIDKCIPFAGQWGGESKPELKEVYPDIDAQFAYPW